MALDYRIRSQDSLQQLTADIGAGQNKHDSFTSYLIAVPAGAGTA